MLYQDELLSRLSSATDQMNVVQLDRDQLSTRLEQLQKAFQEAEEGMIHQSRGTICSTGWSIRDGNYTKLSTNISSVGFRCNFCECLWIKIADTRAVTPHSLLGLDRKIA